MEYTQITIDDYLAMKEKLKADITRAQDKIRGLKHDFVRIGYYLRKIDDGKYYEQDGYKSIAEFAKAECGLSGPDVTRFMQINARYSVDGYSEELSPEFLEYGQSKLAAMLSLPDSDIPMIGPGTSRESIRELGRFNRQEPAAGEADDFAQLVEQFYRDNEETLNAVFAEGITGENTERLIEIVNPSGSRSYRKGMYFVMFYEKKIVVKKFGAAPLDMNWDDFFGITQRMFGAAAGKDTWGNYFGRQVKEKAKTEMPEKTTDGTGTAAAKESTDEAPKPENDAESAEEAPPGSENATESAEEQTPESIMRPAAVEAGTGNAVHAEEIAPAQKSVKEQATSQTKNEESGFKETTRTRKEYLDSLSVIAAAKYIVQEFTQTESLNIRKLSTVEKMTAWLLEDIDTEGRTKTW